MQTDKKIFWGFILFAIFIVLFGYFNIKERIQGPFRIPENEAIITEQDVHQILAQRDTDNDGLSDEDEIFKYSTSIYLDDSDSDGYNDKEEIDAGSNPIDPDSTPYHKESNPKQKIIIPEKQDLSIEEIKGLLVQMGISQEIIDQVDDETLKQIYEETIEETGINPENISINDLGGSVSPETLIQQLSQGNQGSTDLDIAEIRKIMLAAGADPEVLATIDDQTLKQLFIEALNQVE